MPTRKPNKRSSIYLGNDGKWHGWITMGVKDDGSLDRRHREGKTENEVTQKVQELERQRDSGEVSKPGRPPTVEQWMTTYLEDIASRNLARRTYEDYWSKTRNWIVPSLGKQRLDRLTPDHLDRLYAKMLDADVAASTVLKVHRVISRALKIAYRRGKVTRNVATLIDPPHVRESEIEPLTSDEARRVLAQVEDRRNGARWLVALALGLRQGEALGLRWKYVDLETRTIKVWWQLDRATWRHGCEDPHSCGERWHRVKCPKNCKKHRHNKNCSQGCKSRKHRCPRPCPRGCTDHAAWCPRRRGGVSFKEPKGKSKRTVPIPPELVPLLKAHRTAQAQERLAAGEHWEDNDLVFCRRNGRPLDRSDDWREWKAILRAAEVRDARVHDGRHTAGTLLIEQGVHVRTVQEILGHSSVRVTERYTHVASPLAQEAAERMGKTLWG